MAKIETDHQLTYALAADLCSHWKRQMGKSLLSVEDLIKIKEWAASSSNGIIKYPSLLPLANKGLDDLIAENYRTNPPGSNLVRI